MKEYILGIDTSNYTTSVAVTDRSEKVIADERILLKVKDGGRGLRQQEALFQHIKNLPVLVSNAIKKTGCQNAKETICLVSVSDRPRRTEGSYMPCFLAGQSIGRSISSALGVPCMEFSHQEGHIAAVSPEECREFLCYHLSGGTCELLEVRQSEDLNDGFYKTKIIGATDDISLGQLIDRTGVLMGSAFPAGKYMDDLALAGKSGSRLSGIRLNDLHFNVSGLETQVRRIIEDSHDISDDKQNELFRQEIAGEMFERIAALLVKLTKKAIKQTGIRTVVFAGGVSQSVFLRKKLKSALGDEIIFGKYSADNAVGTAFLGGRKLWL